MWPTSYRHEFLVSFATQKLPVQLFVHVLKNDVLPLPMNSLQQASEGQGYPELSDSTQTLLGNCQETGNNIPQHQVDTVCYHKSICNMSKKLSSSTLNPVSTSEVHALNP